MWEFASWRPSQKQKQARHATKLGKGKYGNGAISRSTYGAAARALLLASLDVLAALGAGGVVGLVDWLHVSEVADGLVSLLLFFSFRLILGWFWIVVLGRGTIQ